MNYSSASARRVIPIPTTDTNQKNNNFIIKRNVYCSSCIYSMRSTKMFSRKISYFNSSKFRIILIITFITRKKLREKNIYPRHRFLFAPPARKFLRGAFRTLRVANSKAHAAPQSPGASRFLQMFCRQYSEYIGKVQGCSESSFVRRVAVLRFSVP